MIDETLKEHFDDMENGLGGLMEAVARAQKLGQAAWKEKEASDRTAEALSWTKSVDEATSGIREIDRNIRELAGTSPGEPENTQVRKVGRMLSEAESIEQTARDAIESSIRALRNGLDRFGDQSEAARKAAETAGQLAKVASDAVAVSSKVSREALKTSLEASREAIDRAAEISRNARGVTRVSSDAADDICEASRQSVRSAADESIKAFRKLIVQTEELGRATNAIIEASFREFEKSLGLPPETEFKLLSQEAPAEPEPVKEAVEEPAASVEKAEKEGEDPVQKIIEFRNTGSRLDSLVAMFNRERAS